MSRKGKIKFQSQSISGIAFDLTTHIPDLRTKPLAVEVTINGQLRHAISLYRYGWLNWRIGLPPSLINDGNIEIEISTNRTWQPRPSGNIEEGRDDRDLSIAVCNLEIYD